MKVILYSQPSCPQCRMVHMLLDKNNISYDEFQDVDAMKEKGITHTPMLEVDNCLFSGVEIFKWIKENSKEEN
jgi:glutaredoxin